MSVQFTSVQFTIAKPADWIEIFGDLLNGISGEKPINSLKPELSDFVRKGEKTLDQKKWVAQALPYKDNPTYTIIIHISTYHDMSRILFKN